MFKKIGLPVLLLAAGGFAVVLAVSLAPSPGAVTLRAVNPCAAKTINPCAARTINPCAAKTINPCAARTINPCDGILLSEKKNAFSSPHSSHFILIVCMANS